MEIYKKESSDKKETFMVGLLSVMHEWNEKCLKFLKISSIFSYHLVKTKKISFIPKAYFKVILKSICGIGLSNMTKNIHSDFSNIANKRM